MKGETKELWERLCEQAAVEQDPKRLLELTAEINRLLQAKEGRLNKTVSDHRYPWEEHYLAAVLETDNTKLLDHIVKAHAAISGRQQELASDHGGSPDEQHALCNARKGLGVLSKERIEDSSSRFFQERMDGGNQPRG